MAVFGLDVGRPLAATDPQTRNDRDQTAIRLRDFLASRPDTWKCLRWGRHQAKIVRRASLDLAQVDFAEDGNLIKVHPWLDPDLPLRGLSVGESAAVCAVLAEIYNRTRTLPDKLRPFRLRRDLLREVKAMTLTSEAARRDALHLADRLLTAVWVSSEALPTSTTDVERVDPLLRIQPPPLREHLGPGAGGLVIMARTHPALGAVDLWFQFHHALFDGVPFAEMLSDLERQWGVAVPLVLPAAEPPEVPRPLIRCSGPRAKESWVLEDWLDFRPLLQQRRCLEEQLAERLKGERISTVGLLVWGLAHHDSFEDAKFTVVLDVPPAGERERTLGIAPIRPAVFFDDRDPEAAFLAFNRELGRRLQGTRERRGESYELVESIALLPASLYQLALAVFGSGIRECIGTVGVSVIRDSPVVIAAQTDIHVDGFLGIGRFDLAAEDGGQAGVLMVKGPRERIDGYLRTVRAAVESPVPRLASEALVPPMGTNGDLNGPRSSL